MAKLNRQHGEIYIELEDVVEFLNKQYQLDGIEEENAKLIELFGIDPEEDREPYDSIIFDYDEKMETYKYFKPLKPTDEGLSFLWKMFEDSWKMWNW